jgi:hypothetical protein
MRMAIHLSTAQERHPPVTHSKLEFAIIPPPEAFRDRQRVSADLP